MSGGRTVLLPPCSLEAGYEVTGVTFRFYDRRLRTRLFGRCARIVGEAGNRSYITRMMPVMLFREQIGGVPSCGNIWWAHACPLHAVQQLPEMAVACPHSR